LLKQPVSISLRLTIWFGGIFFLGWLLFGTVMWLNLKSTLKNERYQTLSRRIDRLQQLLNKSQDENEEDRGHDFADFARATGNGLAEIFGADGQRVFPSPSSAAKTFPWPAMKSGDSEQFVHVDSSGQTYWVLARPYTLGGRSLFLLTAGPEAGNLVVLHSFLMGLLASAPILLLISSAGGYLMSRKALKPVDRITATVRSISIRNLSERLPVAKTGDELQRLAETCNAMLQRLESAVGQIKQFTADASHELRGPLSFTRTVAEVALRNPKADAESRKAFEEIVEESAKASDLLEGMLTLARADANSFDAVLEQVDLAAVVQEACAMASRLAVERNLTLTVSAGPGISAFVLGDFSSLRRLVWILLDNALKYTPALGKVEVNLDLTAKEAVLQVSDNGIGIAQADLPHVFDRFYRTDPSRSQVEGSGLGLAIAKWIAEMHRAELSVVSREHKGTTFRLAVPRCVPELLNLRPTPASNGALLIPKRSPQSSSIGERS
jgi:heavy metal sensor kinase